MLTWNSYNLALDFVDAGSCNNPPSWFKNLQVYPDLRIKGTEEPTELTLNSPGAIDFTIGQKEMMAPGWDSKKMWIGWVNQDDKVKVCGTSLSATLQHS